MLKIKYIFKVDKVKKNKVEKKTCPTNELR